MANKGLECDDQHYPSWNNKRQILLRKLTEKPRRDIPLEGLKYVFYKLIF